MNPSVRYELHEFDRLASPHELRDEHKKKTDLIKLVTSEVERIKQTFIHEVFSFEDERHLERYIQYHQQALIRLIDKCTIQLQSNDRDTKDSYRALHTGLENLLVFVERHFTKYFDQDVKAPEGYVKVASNDLKKAVQRIEKALSETKADPRLCALFISIVDEILHRSEESTITYRMVLYAKTVIKEINLVLARVKSVQDIDEELRQLMYYLNYNSIKVLTYHAHFITALIDTSSSRSEKIEKLSFVLKKINQAQVNPGMRYYPAGASLKDQLNSYINEEIEYQEKLQQLNSAPGERPNNPFSSGFRLKFDASVSQLAYLLRILFETKIIVNKNLTQVLQFFARYTETQQSDSVSFGSLRSKFYTMETGARDSVRNMLVLMIEYIDRRQIPR